METNILTRGAGLGFDPRSLKGFAKLIRGACIEGGTAFLGIQKPELPHDKEK